MQTINQSMAADLTYAWPSTVNVANFVSVKPSVEKKGDHDFRDWKEQMLCLLESQEVLGFVDGEIQQPPTEEEKKAWRRTDRLVKGWILGSIGRDALHAVSNKKTARDVWLQLHAIFKEQKEESDENNKGSILRLIERDDLSGAPGGCMDEFNNSVAAAIEKDEESDENNKGSIFERDDFMNIMVGAPGGCMDEFNNSVEEEAAAVEKEFDENNKGIIFRLIERDELINTMAGAPGGCMDEFNNSVEEEAAAIEKEFDENNKGSIFYTMAGASGGCMDEFNNSVEEEAPAIEKDEESDENNKGSGDCSRYLKLYKAAQRGDWDAIKNFLGDSSINESIGPYKETALHVAVLTGKANSLVNKLVEMMPLEALAHKNHLGNTALHNAAIVGNTAAASVLVKTHPELLLIPGYEDRLPVMQAAVYGHQETLEYFLSQHHPNPSLFEGQLGLLLLKAVISSELIDIALDLAHKYPNLALLRSPNGVSALQVIAGTDNLFQRTETFSWWSTLIYRLIPLKKSTFEADAAPAHTTSDAHADIEKANSTPIISGVGQKLELMIWNAIENIVPNGKELRKKKARHHQALQLVQYLCNQLVKHKPLIEASRIFEHSIMIAAKRGLSEVVEIILQTCPSVINHDDPITGMDIFLMAADHRFENVFNLIYNMGDRKYMFFNSVDKKKNNLLHICGKLAPPHRLNLVAGAALQMQRELQWFKEMENFVQPSRKTWKNKERKTPQMVFTKEHKKLKEDGERWMKDTANACTIAATLIATVVFAAAFTVPGGVESTTGLPLLSGDPTFSLFAVSNAVSFFTSITSLLMFLSILTSRYAEHDFLHSLPKRLAIGLLSLFLSITFMLLTFSAALYLLFQRDIAWFGVLVAALACLPVTSFVMLQFPLLVDVIYSTYGPGIFGKKTGRLIY